MWRSLLLSSCPGSPSLDADLQSHSFHSTATMTLVSPFSRLLHESLAVVADPPSSPPLPHPLSFDLTVYFTVTAGGGGGGNGGNGGGQGGNGAQGANGANNGNNKQNAAGGGAAKAAAASTGGKTAAAATGAKATGGNKAVATGNNLQTFTGALGGAAPAVTGPDASRKFSSGSTNTFNDATTAVDRSCSVQSNGSSLAAVILSPCSSSSLSLSLSR